MTRDVSVQLELLVAASNPHLPTFMDQCFGPGNWVFCEDKNLYIGKNPSHKGPGIGFYAIRPNRRWFTGVRTDIESIKQWKSQPWDEA